MDSRLDNLDGMIKRMVLRNINEEIVFLSKGLPIKEKTTLTMRFRDGYSYTEIASLLNFNPSSVSRKINKLLKNEIVKLRKESYASLNYEGK